jgi:hypothetical protein
MPLLLLVPLLLALYWLRTRHNPQASRFDEALDRALLPVLSSHEAQTKLGASTAAQTRILTRVLAERSVVYLAPGDLELWQTTRLHAAEASPQVCAKLWKGGEQTFLGPAIAALGDDALQRYVEMLARGLALRLERKPPPTTSLGAIDRGLSEIADGLPPETEAAFRADASKRELSDARACELFLTLARGSERLEPGLRTDFLRALAKELGGSP